GLITLAETIIRSLKWAGAMEVEAMQSKKDGEFYLIEINPRFPAWIYLATAAGANLPYMYLQNALGKPAPNPGEYSTGMVFTNYTTNLITNLSKIQTLFTTGEIVYKKAV
ncbi:MAG: ATP-grasp domain-containing protein, partial [Nitrospinae bacterium]|nr:ATP-grasp domain-containing protein [Nitrospinota bacterium]